MEKDKGKMKEAAGVLTGDEDKKAEGRAEQRKAAAEKDTAKKAKADRAEEEARQEESCLLYTSPSPRDRS